MEEEKKAEVVEEATTEGKDEEMDEEEEMNKLQQDILEMKVWILLLRWKQKLLKSRLIVT